MIIEGSNFKEKLNNLMNIGWVKTHRTGNTGIGKTLEDLLSIPENNKKIPDLRNAELKSHRKGASSLITLFTLDRDVWKIKNADLIREYGYWDEERSRYAFYHTITSSESSHGLFSEINNRSLFLMHSSGVALGEWELSAITRAFSEKMPNLVFVLADCRTIDNYEEFWYNEAYYLEGVDEEQFIQYLRDGTIVLDIRMHLKESGQARNHGTGFRISVKYLPDLFASKIDLLNEDYGSIDIEDDEQRSLDDFFP